MLCLMHESERRGVLILNGAAVTEDSLSRLLGLDKQILTTTLSTLLSSGVASREEGTGAIYSRRMVRDENLRRIRTEAGFKGGNPVLLNQSQTTKVKQNPTPSSSSSVSTSKTRFLLPSWIDKAAWDGFEEMRKKQRAPLTDRARAGIIKSLEKICPAGDNGAAILDQSTENGWKSIYPLKVNTQQPLALDGRKYVNE